MKASEIFLEMRYAGPESLMSTVGLIRLDVLIDAVDEYRAQKAVKPSEPKTEAEIAIVRVAKDFPSRCQNCDYWKQGSFSQLSTRRRCDQWGHFNHGKFVETHFRVFTEPDATCCHWKAKEQGE